MIKVAFKIYLISIISTIHLGFISAQTAVKYVKPSSIYPEKTEWIILNPDSTFEYFFRIPFVTQNIKGKYSINRDTLILNSDGEKMIITEEYLPELPKKIKRFDVAYFSGNELNYQIIVKQRDKEKLFIDKYGTADIKVKNMKEFCIYSLIKYPFYRLKKEKSNYFKVRINPERVFNDEKWLMTGTKIEPLGLDNKLLEYYLEKE